MLDDIRAIEAEYVGAWNDLMLREGDLSAWAGDNATRKAKVKQVFGEVFGKLRELSKAGSHVGFALTCMGVMAGEHQIRWRYHADRRRVLMLGPRDHGKTMVMAQWLPLEEVARNNKIRILLVRKTQDAARKTLGAVKKIIEEGREFRAQFGDLKGEKWTQTQIYVRGASSIDPTIEAIGIGGAITGNRADLIICDDVIDPINAESESQRRKHWDWFRGTLLELLDPDGRCVVIGTRKHHYDLYGSLMSDDKSFFVVHDRAIDIDDVSKIPHEIEYELIEGQSVAVSVTVQTPDPPAVLWGERWPLEKLLLKRASVGAQLFNRENQNEVVDDDTALFKMAVLEACADPRLSYLGSDVGGKVPYEVIRGRFVAVVQSWDLSAVTKKADAEKADSNWTVCYTVGVDEQGKRWVLNVIRERGMRYLAMKQLIMQQYELYLPSAVIVEANVFQNVFVSALMDETGMPIIPHTTDASKSSPYTGIPAMSVQFENRHYAFPSRTDHDKYLTGQIFSEFQGFGVSRHDDLVMALWFVEAVVPAMLSKSARAKFRKSGALEF